MTAEFLRRLFAAVTQQYLTCDGRVVNGNNNQTRSVSRLRLIDAERDQPIMDLTQGMTSNLANLPTQNLNIQAVTVPSIVGSVRFALDGTTNYRTETGAPYALAGDNAGDYGSTWWPRSTGGRRTLSASGDRDVFEEAFRGGDRAVRNL